MTPIEKAAAFSSPKDVAAYIITAFLDGVLADPEAMSRIRMAMYPWNLPEMAISALKQEASR